MVSNIDQAFIITSLKEPDFSSNLLDKLLVVLEYNHIKPIICITKNDLVNQREKQNLKQIIKYYQKIGYKVLYNYNLFRIKRLFKNKTTVFTGQNLNLETGEISHALGRGRHTTRHVELINMYKGKVLDTPGFSSIDLSNMTKEDIRDSFVEFKNYNCEFKNCMHLKEKKCMIKEAVEKNQILQSRYENYKKFINDK